jgi:F-type H+-transporting ATPase subunit gamma
VKRQLELKQRLHSLRALGEAVGAMKSLSAHHFRDARKTVEPARSYREGVERILGWTGATLPAGDGRPGLLIIGAELGLCGGYNAHLAEAGARRRHELGEGPTLCVGRRAAGLLAARDVEVGKVYEGPTSVRGITSLLLKLAEDVLTTFAVERLSSFDIVASRFSGVGDVNAAVVRLLPLEPQSADGVMRARYVAADQFISAAVREYLYITLYDVLLDALASEHGARLVATEAAKRWLDERIERLRRHLAASQREASTQEVIEIAAGVRARERGA